MKKILLIAATMLCMAFSASAQFHAELTGGLNAARMTSSSASTINLRNRAGYHAGIRAEVAFGNFAKGMYLNAAALWTEKGGAFKQTYTANYIEVPVHIGYSVEAINEKAAIFFEAGPYFGFGMKGNIVAESEYPDLYSGDFFSDDQFKKKDIGGGVRLGLRIFTHYCFYAGYDVSMTNIAQSADDKWHFHNTYLGVAYRF
ncbi:MAG: PorT family protein [Bacteroidales bacterium]|nr:PorT family protein [Bacteroidales bacterium]